MGILYIVATPIGNLEDISVRAVKTLLSVDGILCEDTRRTGLLLKHIRILYDISIYDAQKKDEPVHQQKLLSYYEQNEILRMPEVLNALRNGLNVALVSDAGTPTISDPGFKLVRQCLKEGIRVESIPGPSSVISSLVSSGLPTDKFLFLGYPPRKSGNRQSLFTTVKESLTLNPKFHPTVILFEAPHRLVQLLEELQAVFGDIEIVVARELTKVHEEVRKERISESIKHFEQTSPKGEFVILFNLDDQIVS